MDDTCTDGRSSRRICRITTILDPEPMLTDISIFMIGQTQMFRYPANH
jgi:hypothetical protein